MTTRYLTAREAAEALGISLTTLYAYVSRGLIRSESADASRRTRRYRAEDIEKLRQRQEQRQDPARAVENALHWGAPVMESAITLIADGSLYYRGKNALELALRATVEEVAALIWTGDAGAAGGLFSSPVRLPDRCRILAAELEALLPFEACQLFLPLAAVDDPGAYDLRPGAVAQTGARILGMMSRVAAGWGLEPAPDGGTDIAGLLQRGWVPDRSDVRPLLSAALILCADHELNVSSFTARCIASAGSPPYAVVIAGLAALQGVKHGGHVERVEALMREAGSPAGVRTALASLLRRGGGIAGFGHRLYPAGDPRGRLLLEQVAALRPDAPAVALSREVVRQARELTGEHPTIDLALVTLARALELPPGSALALFALGRTIGWIGHAIEQYQLDRMIRPRARYIGVLPEAGS
jgi:citrate synthase